jgi:N-acetylmuramoyl-L-alanine amidase
MITDGWLDSVNKVVSPNKSGKIAPTIIVMHYTASWRAAGAIKTLSTRGTKVSAQIVVDTDGTITQLVPFDVKAWHAGPSTYKGINGLNSHSIGIEIVNPGYLKMQADGTYKGINGLNSHSIGIEIVNPGYLKMQADGSFKDSNGRIHSAEKVQQTIKTKDPRVGSGDWHWPMYPLPQLEAVEQLTKILIAEYGITDIVSHRQIDTRGWKTDPGPAFPMAHMRALLPDTDNQTDDDVFTSPVPVPKPTPLAVDDPTDEPLKDVPQVDERGHGHGDMNFFERIGHSIWHLYDSLF